MARADGMVDVELVDEPDGRLRKAPAPRRPLPDLSGWVPGVLVVTTVLVIGLGLVGGARVREHREDDARVASFAGVRGVAPSLREPLVERWRTSDPMTVGGDLALVTEPDGRDQAQALLDVGTGRRVSVAPWAVASGDRAPRCPTTIAGSGLQVCEVSGSAERVQLATGDVVQDTKDRLLFLDPSTGGVRDLLVLPDGAIGWQVVGDTLVMAWQDAGTIVVERRQPLTGTVLWREEVPGTHDLSSRQLTMAVADGVVALAGPFAVVLDVTDGRVLAVQAAGPWNIVADPLRVTSGGTGFTVWEPWGGTWFDRSGVEGTFTAGRPVPAAIDDSSAGEVALVGDAGAVRAVDLADGTTLWSSDRVDRVLLRLGGRLVVQDGTALRALDLRSGAELWSIAAPAGPDAASGPVTDGIRLLVVEPATSGTPARLAAHRLVDGATAWTVDLPTGTSSVAVEGGTVVAHGTDLAVVLG